MAPASLLLHKGCSISMSGISPQQRRDVTASCSQGSSWLHQFDSPRLHGVAAVVRPSPCALGGAFRSPLAPRQQRHQQRLPAAPARALPEVVAALAASPQRDLYCFIFAVIGGYVWVKIFDTFASAGAMDKKLSRKLVHSSAGPLFVLTWPLFSADPTARFIAACVPMLNGIRLLSVGLGLLRDDALVASVSRSGDRTELLKGPLYYVLVLVACTVLCWRDNPAGLVAVSLMCGGDGLADIVGRRLGTLKLPYNTAKSFAGSAAMFLGSIVMSAGYLTLFCGMGYFPCYSLDVMLPYLTQICLAATLVESLPINTVFDDNLTVPAVAALLSLLLLPQAQAAGLAALPF